VKAAVTPVGVGKACGDLVAKPHHWGIVALTSDHRLTVC
jgi:hypothetical protein